VGASDVSIASGAMTMRMRFLGTAAAPLQCRYPLGEMTLPPIQVCNSLNTPNLLVCQPFYQK